MRFLTLEAREHMKECIILRSQPNNAFDMTLLRMPRRPAPLSLSVSSVYSAARHKLPKIKFCVTKKPKILDRNNNIFLAPV